MELRVSLAGPRATVDAIEELQARLVDADVPSTSIDLVTEAVSATPGATVGVLVVQTTTAATAQIVNCLVRFLGDGPADAEILMQPETGDVIGLDAELVRNPLELMIVNRLNPPVGLG